MAGLVWLTNGSVTKTTGIPTNFAMGQFLSVVNTYMETINKLTWPFLIN